jgi:serine/threonine protein kinase
MTLAEYSAALEHMEHIKDDEIYPEIPTDTQLTIAPENLGDSSAFVKRPGLNCYEIMKGSNYTPKALLDETLIMEQISKSPRPEIVSYYACRVKRGRITAILSERLNQTLTQYVSTPDFKQLDKVKFVEALESAVDYLHSLGLAHNDINPNNIMVKDGMPVLIDFGSSQPFGKHPQSLGTEGWYKELFFTSEKEHDTYSLGKPRE